MLKMYQPFGLNLKSYVTVYKNVLNFNSPYSSIIINLYEYIPKCIYITYFTQ